MASEMSEFHCSRNDWSNGSLNETIMKSTRSPRSFEIDRDKDGSITTKVHGAT